MTTLDHAESGYTWPATWAADSYAEPGGAPPELYSCCWGAVVHGLVGCTCWEPEYDQAQTPPAGGDHVGLRASPCGDCAYDPAGSPERDEDGGFALGELVAAGEPFYCHAGMRRVVRWRHPAGETVDAPAGCYEPAAYDGVPCRADGRPAGVCAGWLREVREAQA